MRKCRGGSGAAIGSVVASETVEAGEKSSMADGIDKVVLVVTRSCRT